MFSEANKSLVLVVAGLWLSPCFAGDKTTMEQMAEEGQKERLGLTAPKSASSGAAAVLPPPVVEGVNEYVTAIYGVGDGLTAEVFMDGRVLSVKQGHTMPTGEHVSRITANGVVLSRESSRKNARGRTEYFSKSRTIWVQGVEGGTGVTRNKPQAPYSLPPAPVAR